MTVTTDRKHKSGQLQPDSCVHMKFLDVKDIQLETNHTGWVHTTCNFVRKFVNAIYKYILWIMNQTSIQIKYNDFAALHGNKVVL